MIVRHSEPKRIALVGACKRCTEKTHETHKHAHTHKPLNKDGLRSLVDLDDRFEFDRVADVTNEVVLSAVQGSSQVLKKVDEAVGVYALFVRGLDV